MSTYYMRNTTENPSLIKSLLGKLPLSWKRHLLYLKRYRRFGNFRNPRLFSEKMQWRIINDRSDWLQDTCDKQVMKNRVQTLAQESQLAISVSKMIAWEPSAKAMIERLRHLYVTGAIPHAWVLKPNHSSGRALAVVGEPDWTMVESAARSWMKPSRFTSLHWIWPYEKARCGLLAETFISNASVPTEWSLWFMNGSLKYIVVSRRERDQSFRSAYDEHWTNMVSWYNHPAQPMGIKVPPPNFEKILGIASTLAGTRDFIQVDLYSTDDGAVWFGEITPYPSEGLFPAAAGAAEFDRAAGAAWQLPSRESVNYDRSSQG